MQDVLYHGLYFRDLELLVRPVSAEVVDERFGAGRDVRESGSVGGPSGRTTRFGERARQIEGEGGERAACLLFRTRDVRVLVQHLVLEKRHFHFALKKRLAGFRWRRSNPVEMPSCALAAAAGTWLLAGERS